MKPTLVMMVMGVAFIAAPALAFAQMLYPVSPAPVSAGAGLSVERVVTHWGRASASVAGVLEARIPIYPPVPCAAVVGGAELGVHRHLIADRPVTWDLGVLARGALVINPVLFAAEIAGVDLAAQMELRAETRLGVKVRERHRLQFHLRYGWVVLRSLVYAHGSAATPTVSAGVAYALGR